MAHYGSDISSIVDAVWKIAVLIIFLYMIFGIFMPLLSHFP